MGVIGWDLSVHLRPDVQDSVLCGFSGKEKIETSQLSPLCHWKPYLGLRRESESSSVKSDEMGWIVPVACTTRELDTCHH